jgi:hypothetical protein
MRDYNTLISDIQTNSSAASIDTIVSVIKCGVGNRADNVWEVTNSNVAVLQPLTEYRADGRATPLYSSVDMLINSMMSVPDADHPDVNFVLMVITDGEDNASTITASHLASRIRQLQSTDRWTFVFRVPKMCVKDVINKLGVHDGNVMGWEQTTTGVQQATQQTTSAMQQFYASAKAGTRSTKSFYTNLAQVDESSLKQALIDISSEVVMWQVGVSDDGIQVRDFCNRQLNSPMKKGAAFYQLTKRERELQDYKQICIQDKITKSIYTGAAARQLLGLPYSGTCAIAPGDHGKYDIFIQSTSINRKLQKDTTVLYWEKA